MSVNRSLMIPIIRSTLALIALALGAILIVCGLVLVQGRNDETRRVDALVLMPHVALTPEQVNYAVDLYRRGYAARLILAGTQLEQAQATLQAQGLAEEIIIPIAGAASNWRNMQQIAATAREQGIQSVLLVDEPAALLLRLKMARDLGLRAYGSPLPAPPPDMRSLWQAGIDYWGYVLFR